MGRVEFILDFYFWTSESKNYSHLLYASHENKNAHTIDKNQMILNARTNKLIRVTKFLQMTIFCLPFGLWSLILPTNFYHLNLYFRFTSIYLSKFATSTSCYNFEIDFHTLKNLTKLFFYIYILWLIWLAPVETHRNTIEWTSSRSVEVNRRTTTLSDPSLKCLPTNARG